MTRNLKEYAGIHYLIIACGINNIPHEPAANILKKMDQLGQQIGNVPHVFASIPYSPRYSQHFSKIQTVNQWVSEYNLLHSQTCLLLDEPSLTFLSDRLHLDRKSKVEVAGKLSCILDSFFATSTWWHLGQKTGFSHARKLYWKNPLTFCLYLPPPSMYVCMPVVWTLRTFI